MVPQLIYPKVAIQYQNQLALVIVYLAKVRKQQFGLKRT